MSHNILLNSSVLYYFCCNRFVDTAIISLIILSTIVNLFRTVWFLIFDSCFEKKTLLLSSVMSLCLRWAVHVSVRRHAVHLSFVEITSVCRYTITNGSIELKFSSKLCNVAMHVLKFTIMRNNVHSIVIKISDL